MISQETYQAPRRWSFTVHRAISKVLREIEIRSRGGKIGAKLAADRIRWANAAAIRKLCFIGSDGYRLKPMGRRQLRDLAPNHLKLLRTLKWNAWTRVGRPHCGGIVWMLQSKRLLKYRELADGSGIAKLTFLGRALLDPPALPLATHVIKFEYDGNWSRSQANIKISGTDDEAANLLVKLLYASDPDDHPDPSLTARRIDTNSVVGQITIGQAMCSPFAPEMGWDILEDLEGR